MRLKAYRIPMNNSATENNGDSLGQQVNDGCHAVPSIKAFSLVELLIVISIMAVLSSLLSPSLSRMMNTSQVLSCARNEKVIGAAFGIYSSDHDDALPAPNDAVNTWDNYLGIYDGRDLDLVVDDLANKNTERKEIKKHFEVEGLKEVHQLYSCPTDERYLSTALNPALRSYTVNNGELNDAEWSQWRGPIQSGYQVSEAASQKAPWSMRLSSINRPDTAILMTEGSSDLLGHNTGAFTSPKMTKAALKDMELDKHGTPLALNYLFADGHVSFLLFLETGKEGENLWDNPGSNRVDGTLWDCRD
jgi:prepilin-type N-terminal cleavage/methylation domain-containing protein/prepilin-type processing-associated H-X9-DG protein